jgi:predicted ATPase/DNA-binding SARP family transcriptional activator
VEFRILGALAVVDGAREVPIPGAKPRALLALLLLHPGETVSFDRLADDLWGEAVPAGVANALQSMVSKLRRALGDASTLLVTDAHGYRLDVAPEALDAVAFAGLVDEGQAALGADEPTTASELLARGLALWRGPALDGLADEGALRREALRLEELRLTALEDRCDADLRRGRHVELVPELGALVDAHPLRERLHGFLMLALYRSGRQGEALRAYQRAREVLAEELGLEPGVELAALEAGILAQDPGIAAPRAATLAPARGRATLVGGLSRFIGRTDELDALEALVVDHRLVTVVGPGGAGKTRLSLEVAGRRQAELPVWLVELAPLGDPDGVADAVAAVVGVTDGAIGPDGVVSPTVDRMVQHLRDVDGLIVLDNCEHVVSEAARVAEQLLLGCPGLRILATSREALGIGGETIWPVPSMAIDDAIALFVDRAEGSSGFSLTEATATSVGEVCTRLDGLPLAIELAAGRVRAIPVGQLASRLDDRFRLLTGGARTAMPRQQTLRAVVEWSYDLLFDDERRVFERLAVFSGGCSLDAAEAVCAGDDIAPEDVADLLAHLVEKSLVVADHSSGEARYTLLQTLALFGQERLAASEAAEAARARHVAYFADLCDRGWAAFRGEHQVAWLREVHQEADNLRAALGWVIERGDAELALAMLGGLGWSFWFSGRGEEGWRWFVAALDLPGESSAVTRAGAAMWACYVGYAAGTGMDLAIAYGDEAVELAREAGDAQRWAEATMLLAGANIGEGNIERSIELFEQSHAMFSAGDDNWSRALSINAKGRAASLRGDIDLAEQLMTESVTYFEADGVEWAKALVNDDIAQLAEARGDIATAAIGMEGARQAARDLNLGGAEALFTARLGNYALIEGDIERADELHTEALALAEGAGFPRSLAFTYNGRAMVRRTTGDLDEAAEWAERVRVMCHQSRDAMGEALGLASLGFIAERQGDLARAQARHEESLELARQMKQPVYLALALEGFAGIAAARGDGARAAVLLGSAHALRATKGGAPAGPASDVERVTAAAVALIGDAEFAAEHARGEATPYEALLTP